MCIIITIEGGTGPPGTEEQRMKSTYTKDNRTLTVTSPLIRGYQWQLIRHKGQGTYARIAGVEYESPDEEIVIEEWDSPEMRALYDKVSDREAINVVYADIMSMLDDR